MMRLRPSFCLQSTKHPLNRRFTVSGSGGGGAGIGNVHDQMLPTSSPSEWQQLFQHVKRPKTVSIIGAPMTFGQPYVGTVRSMNAFM
jgi:hypothetical protein